MSDLIEQRFSVPFSYPVHFTHEVLEPENPLLARLLRSAPEAKLLFVIDGGLAAARPDLPSSIAAYLAVHGLEAPPPLVVPGGEAAKNDPSLPGLLHAAIARHGLCRHSFLVAVGGGAMLDLAGFAAATAHRGVRLIRLPTTTLAQADSGVGVKNGINGFDKKNFLGTFAPPHAVLIDTGFLRTLDPRERRSGMAEAVKVAILRDAPFFRWIADSAPALARGEQQAMDRLVRRTAELHLAHIAGCGDPFERGSSRPLDFGHWAAHKLERLTGHALRHGEAVALGMLLDAAAAHLTGRLSGAALSAIRRGLAALGFDLFHPALASPRLCEGLAEFREHIGGPLTITLPVEIGRCVEVNGLDGRVIRRAVEWMAAAGR